MQRKSLFKSLVTSKAQKSRETIKKEFCYKKDMQKRVRFGAVTLAALMAGCSSLQEKGTGLEAAATQAQANTEQNIPAKENREYVVTLSPFERYNPPVAKKFISIRNDVRKYLEQGLDSDYEVVKEINIEGYFMFEKLIYDEAKKLGYTIEEVQQMSPKEAALLTCDLIAQRMNYFGITQDYKTTIRRKTNIDKTKEVLTAALKDEKIEADDKKNVEEKMRLLEEIEKKWNELESQEMSLTQKLANLPFPHNKANVDRLFIEKEAIVCRHYAHIANGIFFMLKNKNKNLQNTRVSDYTDRNHCWNQISTVYEKDGKIHIDISFFDPTWYDLHNHLEGYDMRHFPSEFLLMAQCNKLQRKVNNQPATRPSLPWVKFR